ncbi:MAG: homoserine kinase [Chloroflexota bacterium]|nr:homoserine kinase [Chloroflexota bacterium]MDQ5865227.1 homoserine kinase [Chloroflexota bacterium]
MQATGRRLQVRVPATSANLGPGFDVLGLALDLHNVFVVETADRTQIEIEGHAEDLPLDANNLFYRAFRHLFDLAGEVAPPLSVGMTLNIPPGKGLGSSATAVIGGLVAANEFLGRRFEQAELLSEAVKLEHGGHADNVAPALLGGLVVNVIEAGKVISVKLPFPAELKAVVFTPDFPMDTVRGRSLMPGKYSTEDAVYNSSRVALFLAAISQGRYDLLRVAMQDRMHQPYRTRIFPLLPALIEAALQAGAHGACLSGGGSSVLALATEHAEKVAQMLVGTARASGMDGAAMVTQADEKGATATWL